MYGTVGHPFQITNYTAGMLKSCSRAPKSGWHSKPASPERNCEQATQIHVGGLNIEVTGPSTPCRTSFRLGEAIRRTIRQKVFEEFLTHETRVRIIRIAVIPVRQCPVVRATKRHD